MRYFMTIVLDRDFDAEQPAPQELMDAMGPYIEKQLASGKLISTAGLMPARTATRLRGHGGKIATVDGPFAEAKEIIGGYAVIEATDRADALAVAESFVQLHIDHGMPDISVDVREIEGGYNY